MLRMAKEHKQSAPEAAKIIERDKYVDDLIHSCPSVSDAFQRITDVERILSTGSFQIKEWHCSSERLQERLSKRSESAPNSKVFQPQESLDANQISLDGEPGVKTLGVSWKPNLDTINFEVKLNEKELTPSESSYRTFREYSIHWVYCQLSRLKQELHFRRSRK